MLKQWSAVVVPGLRSLLSTLHPRTAVAMTSATTIGSVRSFSAEPTAPEVLASLHPSADSTVDLFEEPLAPWEGSTEFHTQQSWLLDFEHTDPIGILNLHEDIFGLEPRRDILHSIVKWQLAKRRQGSQHVKRPYEVDATTKKMYKQKGLGLARHGMQVAPQFRGGGKAHGPHPRSYEYSLPKKVRRLGLCMALSAKFQEGNLFVLDSQVDLTAPKTKLLREYVEKQGWKRVCLIDDPSENVSFASRNLPNFTVLHPLGLNVYDLLRWDTLVISRNSLYTIEDRLIGGNFGGGECDESCEHDHAAEAPVAVLGTADSAAFQAAKEATLN